MSKALKYAAAEDRLQSSIPIGKGHLRIWKLPRVRPYRGRLLLTRSYYDDNLATPAQDRRYEFRSRSRKQILERRSLRTMSTSLLTLRSAKGIGPHSKRVFALHKRIFLTSSALTDIILPIKYLLLANKQGVKFLTRMRNPAERVLSHYFFWRKTYDPKRSPILQRRAIEENWSIVRLRMGPELRNMYWQFLWAFPLEYFDFIGVTEFHKDDFGCFSRHYLSSPIELTRLNVSDTTYKIGKSLRREIEECHSRDIELYQGTLEMRLRRRSS